MIFCFELEFPGAKKNKVKTGFGKAASDVSDVITGTIKPASLAMGNELVPLGTETGRTLTRLGKLILQPVNGLIWAGEKVVSFVQDKVSEKLEGIPEEQLISPDPQILGPTLEALRYTGSKAEISDMFASLIANSMIKEKNGHVHPSFVEIIKNLSNSDARFFKSIGQQFEHPICNIKLIYSEIREFDIIVQDYIIGYNEIFNSDATQKQASVRNIQRLGLIEIDFSVYKNSEDFYSGFFEDELYVSQTVRFPGPFPRIELQKGLIRITPFGSLFHSIAAC